jgi:hypothetical protein
MTHGSNLLGVPPISYVLPKLMHSYALRLQGLPPNAKVCTVLDIDQCRYWPTYINPPTNLSPGFSRDWPLYVQAERPVHSWVMVTSTHHA